MKWIEKDLKNEPKSLRLHRQKSFSTYDNYAEKDDLRKVLLEEQGYICCYCMSRIQTPTQDKMKIEHWQAQSKFPDSELLYENLFASCRGNEWSNSKEYHCDLSKSENIISLNPTDKTMMSEIIFSRNGLININNSNLQKEIDDIFNLNKDILKTQRISVYKGVTRFLKKEFGQKNPTKAVLNKAIKQYSEKRMGNLCLFALSLLIF